MHFFRAIRLALVFLLLLAACGGSENNRPAGSAASAEGKPLPMDRQVLTIGVPADTYGGCKCDGPGFGKFPLNTSIFDTLVRLNESHQVEPMLAERWEFDEPSNTYRFFLRKDVTFHDGSAFTAEDVKYTFDLFAEIAGANYFQIGPNSTRVVDTYTVSITPVSKNNRSIEQLVHPDFGINKKGSYADPLKPVGTGPYKFVDYAKNDRLTVERFDGHWNQARAAKARRITFRFVGDAQTRSLALRSGDIDFMYDVPRDAAKELEAAPGIKTERSRVGAYNSLAFNLGGEPPFELGRDPAVREAVAVAIDRKALLNTVWAGNAAENTTWIPPSVLGQHASRITGNAYDPRRAERVLDSAGWRRGPDGIRSKDGRRLTLVHLITGSDPSDSVAAAEVIQSQLKQVGIESKIEVPESAAASARSTKGEYDFTQGVGNQNEANPCFLPDLIHYSKTGAPTAKFRAPGGQTDVAIEGCRSATNIEDVRRHAAEAIHQLVDVEHAVIPLIGLYRISAMKSSVAGFVAHPSNTNQRWESIYLVET